MFSKEFIIKRFNELGYKINMVEMNKYIDFCLINDTQEGDERHHILPKNDSMFPEYIGFTISDNIVKLSYKNHLFAHLLLAKALHGEEDGIMWFPVRTLLNINYNKMKLSEEELNSFEKAKILGALTASKKLKGVKRTKEQIDKRNSNMSEIIILEDGSESNKFKIMGSAISKTCNKKLKNGLTIAKDRGIKCSTTKQSKEWKDGKGKEAATNISKSKNQIVEYKGAKISLGRMAALKTSKTMKRTYINGKTLMEIKSEKISKTYKDKKISSGKSNGNANKINIFNENDELMFECFGNMNRIVDENKLPGALSNSHKKNTKLKNGKFKGWYAKNITKLVIELEMRFTTYNEGNKGSKNEAYFSGINYVNDEGTIAGTIGVTSMTEKERDWFHENRDIVSGAVFQLQCNDITRARDSETYALSHPRYQEIRTDKNSTDTLERALELKQMAMELS